MNKTQCKIVLLNEHANRLEHNLRQTQCQTSERYIRVSNKAKALRLEAKNLSN